MFRRPVSTVLATLALTVLLASCGKRYDVCVHGTTPAGAAAAYTAAKQGLRVAVVPDSGTVSDSVSVSVVPGALDVADLAARRQVRGLALKFYRTLGLRARTLEAWTAEPEAAQEIFADWLAEPGIAVVPSAVGAKWIIDCSRGGADLAGAIRVEPDSICLGQAAALSVAAAKRGRLASAGDVDREVVDSLIANDPYLDGTIPDVFCFDPVPDSLGLRYRVTAPAYGRYELFSYHHVGPDSVGIAELQVPRKKKTYKVQADKLRAEVGDGCWHRLHNSTYEAGDTIDVFVKSPAGCAGILLASTANYDEGRVAPYELDEPLRFSNGRRVKTKADWARRREEILEMFQDGMYGRMPDPCEVWCDSLDGGLTAADYGLRKQVRMWFREDRTGPHIDWMTVVPSDGEGPFPCVLMLNFYGNDYSQPDINYQFPIDILLAKGYAFVTACYSDVSPDPDEVALQDSLAFTGVFDLWGPRDTTRGDNTGALAAWAWALSRGMDLIGQTQELDSSRVVLTGCSRLGKAALLAGAFDDRFAVVAPIQTGAAGVPLAKRNFGENVKTETKAFTHWFCGNFRKYAMRESRQPFDQHLLVSCVAPRALFVGGFDNPWFDTRGEFLSLQAASPVWEFLGYPGLPFVEWPDDYDSSAIGGRVAYYRRNHAHGITVADWLRLIDFADSVFSE